MRPIDADELKQDLLIDGKPTYGIVLSLETIEFVIDEQPTVNEWVSVSERLPEGEYDNYIVYTDDDRVCEYDIGSWGNGDWSGCNADGFVPHINVIAWMPFPEYKGDVDK